MAEPFPALAGLGVPAREFVMAAEGGVQGSWVGARQPDPVEAEGLNEPAAR